MNEVVLEGDPAIQANLDQQQIERNREEFIFRLAEEGIAGSAAEREKLTRRIVANCTNADRR